MLFAIDYNKILKNIHYNVNLNYYRYFKPYYINHYNLINKLTEYKSVGLSYYDKYPNASNYRNLNEELFKKNHKAKEEFKIISKTQEQLKKTIINDINMICNNYEINSDNFQSFYIKYDYHIEQNIDTMIDYIKKDIIKNNI
jgi:hypothetical protein